MQKPSVGVQRYCPTKVGTLNAIKTDEGYFIMWNTKELEYSLYFFREKDGSYSFLGLTIGPR
jgi:hypothetical protein